MPTADFHYDAEEEIRALREHREKPDRVFPLHPASRLVAATWNIAQLGARKRTESDYRLVAEMISWFDLVAVQEIRENLAGLRAIQRFLPKTWRVLITDRHGNEERLAFLYRSDRVRPRELVGEVNLLADERKEVKLSGVRQKFTDFDRSPMLCSFAAGNFHFTLANVHIYYGAASGAKFDRRRLEVLAIAVYGKSRHADKTRYDDHLMLIGDFNTPKATKRDKVYRSLLEAGLVPPDTLHGTAVGGDTMGFHKAYDQLVMFPNTKQERRALKGVFDFESAIFKRLYDHDTSRRKKAFFDYVRNHISDHRILWTAFEI